MANLYIHIPFCKQRCIYCDFYFVTTHRSTRPFVETLLKEIAIKGATYGKKEAIDTIYFGGGTPSQLAIEEVERILHSIGEYFDTSPVEEVTFEINPDDVDTAYLTALRETGVDRLSIGIQSFSDADLQWMNRAHTRENALKTIQDTRDAGYTNFSIDLIFGRPSQTLEEWKNTLAFTRQFAPPHISTYSLTIEPGTPLHKRIKNKQERQPEEEALATFYRATMEAFAQQGYEHYEVSSFALENFRSKHNQAYWTHKNYLGFGPSAHSFWNAPDLQAKRWKNVSNLKEYIHRVSSDQPPHSNVETLSSAELLDEYIMLRLRTKDGLDLEFLDHTFNMDFYNQKRVAIEQLLSTDHLSFDSTKRLSLTEKGFLVCDAIVGELIM